MRFTALLACCGLTATGDERPMSSGPNLLHSDINADMFLGGYFDVDRSVTIIGKDELNSKLVSTKFYGNDGLAIRENDIFTDNEMIVSNFIFIGQIYFSPRLF
eukprot:Trichotokara_eunicae@DN9759_c0_g1_i1.p1